MAGKLSLVLFHTSESAHLAKCIHEENWMKRTVYYKCRWDQKSWWFHSFFLNWAKWSEETKRGSSGKTNLKSKWRKGQFWIQRVRNYKLVRREEMKERQWMRAENEERTKRFIENSERKKDGTKKKDKKKENKNRMG